MEHQVNGRVNVESRTGRGGSFYHQFLLSVRLPSGYALLSTFSQLFALTWLCHRTHGDRDSRGNQKCCQKSVMEEFLV
jgi:hypothetical protein